MFPAPDRASLLAHRGSWEALPARPRRVLSRVSYPLGAVNEMDLAVNLRGRDPLPAVWEWMDRNPRAVDAWFG